MVSFPIVGDADNAALVAWTTTPWTLPSNLALCVNANLMYAKVGTLLFLNPIFPFHFVILAHCLPILLHVYRPPQFVSSLLFPHFFTCKLLFITFH